MQVDDTHRVPQRHLSLAHATEAGSQDLPSGHEHCSDRPGAVVRLVLLLQVCEAEQSSVHHYSSCSLT